VANATYDVFVSYSRADARHASDIDAALRSKGLRPFFDRRSLAPGLPWPKALEQAIGAAKAAIVLIGPRGLGNTQQYKYWMPAFAGMTAESVARRCSARDTPPGLDPDPSGRPAP
jgi:hypothetical protein